MDDPSRPFPDFDPSGGFAVIADVHGNAHALRVVLEDIAAQGLHWVINLGDHFSGPLDAAGSWAQMSDLIVAGRMIAVRGNHDRYLVSLTPDAMWASDRIAHEALPDEALDWIDGLPFDLDLGAIYLCHATPGDDNLYWTETVSEGGVRRADPDWIEAQADKGGLANSQADLILYAHTHLPRVLHLRNGRMMVNPGSVGCPAYSDTEPAPHVVCTGTPMASYAVIRGGPGAWEVTHRHLPYDWAAAVDQALSHGAEEWAKGLRGGWL
jgi:predicted phosphodiesterase